MESVEVVVIGAGVIGLAVARELARAGREVVVLEANAAIGQEASSRNSEVIHAGIYYPAGSIKAELCVRGRQLLYRYCEARAIPCRQLGKLVVAVSADQQGALQQLQRRAAACGVADLQWLDGGQLRQWEPDVVAEAALLSPATGIVDSHALMLSLQGELERAGGVVVFNSPVLAGGGAGARRPAPAGRWRQ